MHKFSVSIHCSCDVEFRRTDLSDASPVLRWESNVPDAFSVRQSQNHMAIRQTKNSGGTTIISSGGGRTVISSGSGNVIMNSVNGVVIGGASGGVWVNGVEVTGAASAPLPEAPRLIVWMPDGSDLALQVSSSVEVTGEARIGQLDLTTSGSSEIRLICHSARLNTSGSSDIALTLMGGGISSSFSGSTRFTVSTGA